MITALLELNIGEDRVEDAPAVLHETLAATRAFDGCLSVDVLMDVDDPQRVLVQERWASREQDAAYRAWRATPAGASALETVLTGPPKLSRYEQAEAI